MLKTFLRIIGRIIGNLVYYSTAIIIALIITVGIFFYIGMQYYNGYYQEYMDVQEKWSQTDNYYVEYINKLDDNFDLIKNTIEKVDKESHQNKIELLRESIRQGTYSMSYNEKFTSYPQVVNSGEDVTKLLADVNDDDITQLVKDLNSIKKNIEDSIAEYNEAANEFNQNNDTFPENLISEIGSFHNWEEL